MKFITPKKKETKLRYPKAPKKKKGNKEQRLLIQTVLFYEDDDFVSSPCKK